MMDFVAAFFGISGTLCLALKKYPKSGWILLIIASLCWIYVGYEVEVYGLMVSAGTYIVVQLVGLKKADKEKPS